MTFEIQGPGDPEYDRLMDQFTTEFGIERDIEKEKAMVEEVKNNPDAMRILEDMTKIFESALGDSLSDFDLASASVAGISDTVYHQPDEAKSEMEENLIQSASEVMTSEAEAFLKSQE